VIVRERRRDGSADTVRATDARSVKADPLSPPTFASARFARGLGWQAASGEFMRRLSRRSPKGA